MITLEPRITPQMQLVAQDPLDAMLLGKALPLAEEAPPRVQATGYRPIEVLLVEDNPGDVRLIMEALRAAGRRLHVSVANDGDEALARLYRYNSHFNAPRPDLILLDLNLPRRDGRELLAELKADAELKSIPVIVLTSSQSPADVRRAYELNANCYVTKPVGLEQFFQVMKSIQYFWATIVEYPGS